MITFSRSSNDLQKVAQKVLKDRNMRITREFVPAASEYNLRLNASNRVRLLVSDNELRCYQETKLGDDWIVVGRKLVQGTIQEIENSLTETVAAINKYISK